MQDFLVVFEKEQLLQVSPPHDDLPDSAAPSPTRRRHESIQLFCPFSFFKNRPFVLKTIVLMHYSQLLFLESCLRPLKGSQILTVCALTQAECQYPLSVCIKDTPSCPVEGLAAGQWAHVWRQQWKQTKDRKKTKGKGAGLCKWCKGRLPTGKRRTLLHLSAL